MTELQSPGPEATDKREIETTVPYFEQKLASLPDTIDLVLAAGHRCLSRSLREAGRTPVLAVGSGGSAVTAEFFARCHETLFGGVVKAITPTELTLGAGALDCDVWLFSAGADNSDFRAALQSARVRGARRITVLTRRADAAEELGGAEDLNVHVIPVATEKDSFLATHSLVSSVVALLIASNRASGDPVERLEDTFKAIALAELKPDGRQHADTMFGSLNADDTLLIIADPQVASVSSLLETSAWEASICPVQLTDFRNFAHGRHTWLHHRPDKTLILALTGHDSEELWERTVQILPAGTRHVAAKFGNCGRFQNAVGLVRGLVWIAAMGRAVGIDPGKPGIADFGRSLYKDDSLPKLSEKLAPPVRQKRAATLERDDPNCEGKGILAADRDRVARLRSASIGGIVLDYDGTLVTTEQRLEPPAEALLSELERLHGLGVRLAIATGRGGSAGEMLRKVLPPAMHPHVLMGYYNGGYVRRLDIDIRDDPPEESPEIVETAAWFASRSDLFIEAFKGEHSRVQVSVQLDNVRDPERFSRELATCEPMASGAVRVTRSGHSLDLIPAGSSKINVADRLAQDLAADVVVLRLGDQGGRAGNDNEFLTHPYGISVHEVCGRDSGCWSLFGAQVTGPDALLRLLQALKPDVHGRVRIDMKALELDPSAKEGTNRER